MLHPIQKPETAIPGSWDRQAGCFPGQDQNPGQESFSIGIFEWVPAKGGGCKKAKAHQRVHGSAFKPELALARADAIVANHNSQIAVARAKGQGDSFVLTLLNDHRAHKHDGSAGDDVSPHYQG